MQTNRTHRPADFISYLFIILFMYTAAAKFFTLSKFASTLGKSPLIGHMATTIAWMIPVLEIAISILLVVRDTRKKGLCAALALMALFTTYLIYMVMSGSKLPCHCGGVVSSLSWQQHIWFNLAWVCLAFAGIRMHRR